MVWFRLRGEAGPDRERRNFLSASQTDLSDLSSQQVWGIHPIGFISSRNRTRVVLPITVDYVNQRQPTIFAILVTNVLIGVRRLGRSLWSVLKCRNKRAQHIAVPTLSH